MYTVNIDTFDKHGSRIETVRVETVHTSHNDVVKSLRDFFTFIDEQDLYDLYKIFIKKE